MLFSLKQEASASIGGGTFTLYYIYFHQANNGQSILIILYHVAKLRAKKIPCYNYMPTHPQAFAGRKKRRKLRCLRLVIIIGIRVG